jgi:hypothetical protein
MPQLPAPIPQIAQAGRAGYKGLKTYKPVMALREYQAARQQMEAFQGQKPSCPPFA